MASEPSVSTLGELFPLNYGKGLRTKDRKRHGAVEVFGSNGPFDRHDEALTAGPTVIVGRKGSVGEVHFSKRPCWVGDTAFYVEESDGYDIRYVFYLLRWLPLTEMNTDAAVPGLNRNNAHRLEVPVIPLIQQQAIAEVLGALDDRIEWCHQIGATLLEIAQTVWDDACVRHPVSLTVGDLAEFENRKRVPLSGQERESRQGPYPYYGATGVFGHVNDYLFDGPRVLVGEDGSVVNADGTAVVQYPWGRFWVNNHAHVLQPKTLTVEQLFLALRRTYVSGFVTGAAQPKLSMGRLKQVPLEVPDERTAAELSEVVATLFEGYREVIDEVSTLASLRDLLVPELLSGRLPIDNPERLSEGAM